MDDNERNKAIARRTWEEIFPACDVEALAEIVDPDVVSRGRRPDEPTGFEGVKRTMLWLASVFSEAPARSMAVIGERRRRLDASDPPRPPDRRLMGIPPTIPAVATSTSTSLRVHDGKVVEQSARSARPDLMRQLARRAVWAAPRRAARPGVRGG